MDQRPAKAKTDPAVIDESPLHYNIGKRLAVFRGNAKLTLNQLSEASGISEATLSRVENNVSSLNAHNLFVLSRVLGVGIEAFFRDDAVSFQNGMRSITRRGRGEPGRTERYELEVLCAELSKKRMHPAINRIRARTLEEVSGLRAHAGEEFIYVLSGSIEIHTDLYRPAHLEDGDSMYLDSTMGHAYVNVGEDEEAVILVVATVDTSIRSASPEGS